MNYHKVSFLASYGLLKQIPPSSKIEIAFAGRSNVGKSSLINKLFNRKSLARVSAVPGKTATINFYGLDNTVHIVDLPGYGYAKVAKTEKIRWAELIALPPRLLKSPRSKPNPSPFNNLGKANS